MAPRFCANERCAQPFLVANHGRGVHRFCSRKCGKETWRLHHRRKWNRIMLKANRKSRAGWTPERRQSHREACKAYHREHAEILKRKRCLT